MILNYFQVLFAVASNKNPNKHIECQINISAPTSFNGNVSIQGNTNILNILYISKLWFLC